MHTVIAGGEVVKRQNSRMYIVGLLGGGGIAIAGLHSANHGQVEMALAFTLFPVNSWIGMLAVIGVAVVVLSYQTTSPSFFWGALAGVGLVLSFDVVWVHWIFGLHHLTNTRMDIILESLLVFFGLLFLWSGSRESIGEFHETSQRNEIADLNAEVSPPLGAQRSLQLSDRDRQKRSI
jgi:hypothetical protein